MNPIQPQAHAFAIPTTTDRLSSSGALRQLGRNTRQIARNLGQHLLQDHHAIKTNSLIASSLILVLSRILVANYTAFKSKGTKDGPYRYREAMRTNIRELCGWTFGFVVLRYFQGLTKKAIGKFFGITESGGLPRFRPFKQLKTAFNAAVQKKPFQVGGPPVDPALPRVFDFSNKAAFRKVRPILERIPGLRGKPAHAMLQAFYNWTPILLGSIPAVFLAGYALERFTRDHSDQVVDMISQRFNRNKAASAGKGNAPMPGAHLNHFMSRLQQRQELAGLDHRNPIAPDNPAPS